MKLRFVFQGLILLIASLLAAIGCSQTKDFLAFWFGLVALVSLVMAILILVRILFGVAKVAHRQEF